MDCYVSHPSIVEVSINGENRGTELVKDAFTLHRIRNTTNHV